MHHHVSAVVQNIDLLGRGEGGGGVVIFSLTPQLVEERCGIKWDKQDQQHRRGLSQMETADERKMFSEPR